MATPTRAPLPLLDIRNASRRFGELSAVDGVSLQIEAGEFFTLLGPSGCGKTTLLRLIAGFEPLDQGQIFLGGRDMSATPPEARPIHTVFQNYALFPHMSVAGNIGFPLRMRGVARAEIQTRVREALEDVQLPQMASRYPDELSGGQRQRVAIARALIDQPQLLLLDEPLAALDLKLREQMRVELIKLQQEVGITFVYVTHDQSEALALSHRIAVMNEGKVIQVGTPDAIYECPINRFVADFIGNCNLIDVVVAAVDGLTVQLSAKGMGTIRARVEQPVQPGQAGVLALRPERLRIDSDQAPAPDENRFDGTIRHQLYLGDVTRYRVELHGGVTMEVLLPNAGAGDRRVLAIGDQVQIAWHDTAGRFLNA